MSRMSYKDGAVSHKGLLQNMLHEGFSLTDCLCELVDDSLGAGAEKIKILITDREVIVVDAGSGMNEETLGDAHVLHNRTKASKKKHGRFGIGRKHALVYFTQLKGVVRTITRCAEGKFELKISFPDVIAKDHLNISPHEATESGNALWNKYAIEGAQYGTITIMEADPEVLRALVERLETRDPKLSLPFCLATTYATPLSKNLSLRLFHNAREYDIVPVDLLSWDAIDDTDKREMTFSLYRIPSGEVRTYFTHNNATHYRTDTKFIKEAVPTGSFPLGQVLLQSTCSREWETILESEAACMNLDLNLKDLAGRQYNRNEKQIAHFKNPLKKGKGGDFDKDDYHGKFCHHRISWDAEEEDKENETPSMDSHFAVEINKQRLNEDLMKSYIVKPLLHFCKDFENQMYKMWMDSKEPIVEEPPIFEGEGGGGLPVSPRDGEGGAGLPVSPREDSSSSSSSSPSERSATPPPIPKKGKKNAVAKPSVPEVAEVAESPRPVFVATDSTVHRKESEVHRSVTPQEVLVSIHSLLTEVDPDRLAQSALTASTTVVGGLVNHTKAIKALREFLEEYQVFREEAH